MAFDIKTFTTRSLTALVFVAVMMAGLLGPMAVFIALFAVVVWIGLHEYARLLHNIVHHTFTSKEIGGYVLLGMIAFVMTCLAPMQAPNTHWPYNTFGVFFYVLGIFIGGIMLFYRMVKSPYKTYLLCGIGYVGVALGMYVQMRIAHPYLPLALIALIWTNDTMAYLSGSFIGKNPLMPTVSPKKTIEGTLGGIVFTVFLAWVGSRYMTDFSPAYWMALAFIASVIGTAGDLIESKLKRMAGVKDSGTLMPGHGGVLDRFDSLLLAAPVACIMELLWPR